ncbi:MAG TPA: hypothetical protein VIJ94_17625 [Caulobacteraceae bacterium]
MTRTTYVLRGGELIDKRSALPLHAGAAAPMIRADGMAPVRSMADGRVYESRSGYYASVRAAGCEIVGDERAPFERRPAFEPGRAGADIKTAIEQLRSR